MGSKLLMAVDEHQHLEFPKPIIIDSDLVDECNNREYTAVISYRNFLFN